MRRLCTLTRHGLAVSRSPIAKRQAQACKKRACPPRHRQETAMLKENLFQKIIDKQIPASIVYEDDRCLAFRDTNPQAPTHVLIIPRKVIPTHDDLTEADRELVGHLHIVAVKLARE